MTRSELLVDSGPLVAVVSPRDEHHETCSEFLRTLRSPLVTCWPVIAECVWLLRTRRTGVDALFRMFDEEVVQMIELGPAALSWCARFMQRYWNINRDLADAALCYLAETRGNEAIFTLDRRDFSVYRLRGNRALRVVPS